MQLTGTRPWFKSYWLLSRYATNVVFQVIFFPNRHDKSTLYHHGLAINGVVVFSAGLNFIRSSGLHLEPTFKYLAHEIQSIQPSTFIRGRVSGAAGYAGMLWLPSPFSLSRQSGVIWHYFRKRCICGVAQKPVGSTIVISKCHVKNVLQPRRDSCVVCHFKWKPWFKYSQCKFIYIVLNHKSLTRLHMLTIDKY